MLVGIKNALVADTKKVRRWATSGVAFLVSGVYQVVSAGYEAAVHWTLKEWAQRIVIATAFAALGAAVHGGTGAASPPAPPKAG